MSRAGDKQTARNKTNDATYENIGKDRSSIPYSAETRYDQTIKNAMSVSRADAYKWAIQKRTNTAREFEYQAHMSMVVCS